MFNLNAFKYAMNQRISIICQVSKAIDYIHSKQLLHRDISLCNVLIFKYDDAIVVKLSDFGLVKNLENQLTSSQSSVKGNLNDHSALSIKGFSNYDINDEIYALTNLFSIIISGKINLQHLPKHISNFRLKGLNHELDNSYRSISDLKNAAISCISCPEQTDYYMK